MYVEPYVHLTIDEVDKMGVTEDIKLSKRYFSQWQKSIDINQVATKTLEVLTKELTAFALKNKPDEKIENIDPEKKKKFINN